MATRKIDLPKFRHAVSVLKKQGIISNVDARTAQPYMIRGGQRLDDTVKKYRDVVAGTATAVPKSSLEKDAAKKYKTRQTTTKAHRWDKPKKGESYVIVPHAPEEKVRVEKGHLVYRNPSGIERVEIPVPYHNLEQYLTDIQKDGKRINAMKERREFFGFRFFGHRSGMYSGDIASLIEELMHYESVETAINDRDSKDMNEMYRNLEIIRFRKSSGWLDRPEGRSGSQKYSHAKYIKRKKKLAKGPAWKREEAKAKNAEYNKAYRERLKADPKKYAEYKAAGAKRSTKSRKSKKKGKKKS